MALGRKHKINAATRAQIVAAFHAIPKTLSRLDRGIEMRKLARTHAISYVTLTRYVNGTSQAKPAPGTVSINPTPITEE